MSAMTRFLRTFAAAEGGATAIEYGMIASLVVVVIIAAIQQVGGATTAMYALITAAISGAIG